MTELDPQELHSLLTRVASALERMAPPPPAPLSLEGSDVFVWHPDGPRLDPVARPNRLELDLLRGIDRQSTQLHENTLRFARGLPANNALLWGARGTGKSSLVKSVHAAVNEQADAQGFAPLALIEIHREDIPTLPRLLSMIRTQDRRCLLFCDDLSFDHDDTSYKSLKAVLEGGVEGRPENVAFYATSNRRHLLPRDMIENERSTAINPCGSASTTVISRPTSRGSAAMRAASVSMSRKSSLFGKPMNGP